MLKIEAGSCQPNDSSGDLDFRAASASARMSSSSPGTVLKKPLQCSLSRNIGVARAKSRSRPGILNEFAASSGFCSQYTSTNFFEIRAPESLGYRSV